MDDLAKRAVACKGWRWLSGMQPIGEYDIPRIGSAYEESSNWCDEWDARHCVPDLDDPATRGCLLELVRLAWGDPTICTRHEADADGGSWVVALPRKNRWGKTEAAALVAALEAAPEK